MDGLIDALTRIVGAENLADDSLSKDKYGLDWTRFYSADPEIIVFPRSIEMVQQLVKFANENDLPLVPSGGRTGLSGGAVATNREIVVSFEKMNRILEFDRIDDCVTVEPGVITQQLQAFAEDKGLFYPVDFASSGSSQIGGNIATNAGGIKVVRYGLTRDWVVGLKVVTGSGELLNLNRGLVKNATGYDLRHLFIGSEGTLGLVVEATMKLTSIPQDLTVVLLEVPRMSDIIAVLQTFREAIQLSAFEFFSEAALQHVLNHSKSTHPFTAATQYYALLEFENESAETMKQAMKAFETCVEQGWVIDGVVSKSEQQRRDMWAYRERISEAITPFTPYKNDIAVRVSQVPRFLLAVEQKVLDEYPAFEIVWFGHIGDGNLHLNILKPGGWDIDDFKHKCEKVSNKILAIVEQFGGSISAEHGVGLLKRGQLGFSKSAAEIALMKSVKQVFDPKGIMNPGKLLAP
ncbi:MAG: FAD-binding oxidoreductase [bacterium]|nr:FAD-binding oxidoreductase [Gammaproteobacteria bacterium]